MKWIASLVLAIGFGCLPAQSGEIVKRQVQYGQSDEISTQYVFQGDKRKSKSNRRTREYRPIRSDGYQGYAYRPYYVPSRSYVRYSCPPVWYTPRFSVGCVSISLRRYR